MREINTCRNQDNFVKLCISKSSCVIVSILLHDWIISIDRELISSELRLLSNLLINVWRSGTVNLIAAWILQ